jgi:hypothetical protein
MNRQKLRVRAKDQDGRSLLNRIRYYENIPQRQKIPIDIMLKRQRDLQEHLQIPLNTAQSDYARLYGRDGASDQVHRRKFLAMA